MRNAILLNSSRSTWAAPESSGMSNTSRASRQTDSMWNHLLPHLIISILIVFYCSFRNTTRWYWDNKNFYTCRWPTARRTAVNMKVLKTKLMASMLQRAGLISSVGILRLSNEHAMPESPCNAQDMHFRCRLCVDSDATMIYLICGSGSKWYAWTATLRGERVLVCFINISMWSLGS